MSSPAPYVHARTADAAMRWLADMDGCPIVAVDTETSGYDPLRDELLLVQVAAGPDRPVLVLDAQQVAPQVLAPMLADDRVLKVFHHGSFDLRFLALAGVEVERVADTMLAQQLLDGGEAAGSRALAQIASFRLGVELDKSVRGTFGDASAPTGPQLQYAADDAATTWLVFDQQWRELVGHGLVDVARIEFAVLPVLADLQLRGVAFDADRWLAVVGALEQELPALAQRAQDALITDSSPRDLFGPTPVNLDSPEQVRDALARIGVDVPSTREHVLRDHAGHPAVAALLEYRQVSKVTTNWGGDWARRVRHPVTGRVHADWRQIVGAGRIACSDPNLTQVPKREEYRACFGGEPGRALIVADYSQQELRILAAVSDDAALRAVFEQGGDLHRATAATIFDVPEGAVNEQQRALAKQLNFGLMYGMGAPGFARATGMTLQRATETMSRYFATFPQVAAWLAATEASARRSGSVRTPMGRVRRLSADTVGLTTLARNAPIQGAGADMTKLAMVEVEGRLRRRFGAARPAGRGARPDGLVLVVHDELVADVPSVAAMEVAADVEAGMLAAAGRVLGEVPARVDVRVQERWGAEKAVRPGA